MTVSFKTSTIYQQQNKSTKFDKNLPLKTAGITAATWTCFGLGVDYLIMNKCFKFKTSKKQSLIINGIVGLCAGIYSYFKTRKLQSSGKMRNLDDFVQNYNTDKS